MINSTFSKDSDRGSILPLFAMVMIALAGVVAVVIDISRHQVVGREVQNAADAVALAAADRLDGSRTGWLESKRAALAALRLQRIGMRGQLFSTYEFNQGLTDPQETNPLYQKTRAGEGTNAAVSVERGTYWLRDGSFQFESLEGSATISIPSPTNAEPNRTQAVPVRYGLPTYFIGNAVRVTLTVGGVPTMFAGVFGEKTLRTVTRESIAVYDDHLETQVYPIAIPACQLLMDMNINRSRRFSSEEFQPGAQCSREVLAAEAEARGPDIRVFGGRTRYEIYMAQRLTTGTQNNVCNGVAGATPNCKSLPIYATLGVHGGDAPRAAAPDEVAEVLKTTIKSGPAKVPLGSRFHPLEDGPGFLSVATENTGTERLLDVLREALNSQSTLRRVGNARMFGSEIPESSPNYPTVQRTNELIQWPPYGAFTTLEVPNPKLTITNPMCHDPSVGVNPTTGNLTALGGVALDPARQEPMAALPVRVMVVAPADANSKYCDFASVFGDRDQDAADPTSNTDPIVVGFVDAFLFDFRLTPFDPREVNPQTNMPIVDRNMVPGMEQPERIAADYFDGLRNQLRSYVEGVKQKVKNKRERFHEWKNKWDECKRCNDELDRKKAEAAAKTPPETVTDDCDDECLDYESIKDEADEESEEIDPRDLVLEINQPPENLAECFYVPADLGTFDACRSKAVKGGCSLRSEWRTLGAAVCQEMSVNDQCDQLKIDADMIGEAKPNKSCLPFKDPLADPPACASDPGGCDVNNPNHRIQLGETYVLANVPLNAGCGGLRMRLSCDNDRNFLSPVRVSEAIPSLVN